MIVNQTIQEFAKKNSQKFDVVCSFQVLEHVADVKNFISSSLAVLRPGGRMIISVPNNDAELIKQNDFILNLPPHHMGLWDLNSLIKLQHFFALRVESIHLEPLQAYHVAFMARLVNRNIEEKLNQKIGSFSSILAKMAHPFSYWAILAMKKSIIGHTVLVAYTKTR